MRSWLELEVGVPAAAADAVCSRIFDLGSTGLELEEHDDTVFVRAYFPNNSPAHPATELESYLHALQTGYSGVRWRSVNEEEWAESWKQWFHPIAVGRRLWVTPPWHTSPPPGRLVLTIEPGMAFGTGHHPSTLGCLELIEEVSETTSVARALDLGTGSGILAIALAKLGVAEVRATDIDPTALQVAWANVSRNGVGHLVTVDRTWEPGQRLYDLVAANLYRSALEELAGQLARAIAHPGHLVCAGFYASDVPAVLTTLTPHGFALERRWECDEWAALWLKKSG